MRTLHATVAALLAVSSPLGAIARAAEARLRQLAVDELKRTHLACDQAGTQSRMGFDDDGERLFAGSRAQRRTEHAQADVR